MLLGVELAQEAQPRPLLDSPRHEARVDPDRLADAELVQEEQELSLAAADLEHPLASQSVPVDPAASELLDERDEVWREGLRLLVVDRVVLHAGVESRVGDQPAGVADRERQPAGRERERLLLSRDEAATVHRHALDL